MDICTVDPQLSILLGSINNNTYINRYSNRTVVLSHKGGIDAFIIKGGWGSSSLVMSWPSCKSKTKKKKKGH